MSRGLLLKMLSRIFYILKRLSESPINFLIEKFKLELSKIIISKSKLIQNLIIRKSVRLSEAYFDPNSSRSIFDEATFEFSNDEVEYLLNRCRSIENNQWKCLGYGEVDLQKADTFNTDCKHGFKWPSNKPSFKIDFINESNFSDVKIPWEKSRLQWLVELSLLVKLDRLDKSKVINNLSRWAKENNYLEGVNWISSMEVAIRLINIILIFDLIKNKLNKYECSLFNNLFAMHSSFLKCFPEISDVPGNHYLFTQVGSLVCDIVESKPITASAFYELVHTQFNDDGFHIEHSSIYHRLCVDITILGYSIYSREKQRCVNMESFILSLIEVCNLLSSKAGMLPVMGDSDSGSIFNFGQNSRDVSLFSKAPHLQSITILQKVFNAANPLLVNTFKIDRLEGFGHKLVYPYFILETDRAKLIIRIGKPGLKLRAPHDHDDFLSFWLFVEKADIFIEGGAAPYTLSKDLRETYISSKQHNCISLVNGERSRFKRGSVFSTLDADSYYSDYLYCKKNQQLTCIYESTQLKHIRTLGFENGFLTINDKVSNYQGPIVSKFHFNPTFDLLKYISLSIPCEVLKGEWFDEYGSNPLEMKSLVVQPDSEYTLKLNIEKIYEDYFLSKNIK